MWNHYTRNLIHSATQRSGPLFGLKIIEFGGIGPAPFASMMLADHGAEVIRIDKISDNSLINPQFDILRRGRQNIAFDLKQPQAIEIILQFIESADGIIEGFRPGVMERLGLGPDICLNRNPQLVYGRMTGWGQTGPLSQFPGHDLNYISLAGALSQYANKIDDKPTFPLNIIGDFAGGGMMLAFGMVAALLEASKSGKGQVIDCSMVDGTAILHTMFHGFSNAGLHSPVPGSNLLDGGAHFYQIYETLDGKYLSIAAIEPQFYAELLRLTGLNNDDDFKTHHQMDKSFWPVLQKKLADTIITKTQLQWVDLFNSSEIGICHAPVLTLEEAKQHEHLVQRQTFIRDKLGNVQPNTTPRFSRSISKNDQLPATSGEHTIELLKTWGKFSDEFIDFLLEHKIVAQHNNT